MYLKLDNIVVDAKFQSRVQLDREKIEDYAELYNDGVKFPPVNVVMVDSVGAVLVDGFHRFKAVEQLGDFEIEVVVLPGSTEDDALLASCAANKAHGLNRTDADKRKAVEQLLAHPKFSKWTQREIAKHCGVTQPYVHKIMKDMEIPSPRPRSAPNQKPVKEVPEVKATPVVEPVEPQQVDNEDLQVLVAENERLQEQIALGTLPEEDREAGRRLMDDMKAEIKLLQAELKTVTTSRDTFQAENAQLKKQVIAQQRRIKKLEQELMQKAA